MDYKEVSKHNTADSCWVILYGSVYDVTSFLPQHPGGSKIILQLAGRDATSEYDPVHPPGTLEDSLPASARLGEVDSSTLPTRQEAPPSQSGAADSQKPPPLDTLLNLDDIEAAATRLLSPQAWGYYYSASDDLLTKARNTHAYRSILLRPRIFVDCTRCDPSTRLLAHRVQVPFFVSPAAMARLAHPDGEAGIAAACAAYGAAQIVSNNASMTPEQIVRDVSDDVVFGWQLYVQTDRRKSEAMLARIAQLPQFKFVVLTLDAPVPSKREHDERVKHGLDDTRVMSAVQAAATEPPSRTSAGSSKGGVGKAVFAGTAADLTWRTTLPWLAQHTALPIVLKGIQTHEDAYLASLYAPQVQGIILSNHGGRAVDTAPPPLHTLLEIRKYCPEVLQRVAVFVDGGIKRGTDIVKALCLGAQAVGIGRAPLYGLGVAGQSGVERMFEILKDEVETCMRLLGVEDVSQLGLQHVNVRALEREIYDGPSAIIGAHLPDAAKAKL